MKTRILEATDAADFQGLRLRGLAEFPNAFSSSVEEEEPLTLEIADRPRRSTAVGTRALRRRRRTRWHRLAAAGLAEVKLEERPWVLRDDPTQRGVEANEEGKLDGPRPALSIGKSP